ncbi:MAG: GIY-YIG nuclease family protein [Chitinispirillales bacterium]|jgi:putative endonuclease|nr:GIY-YIG nuclease family protein [Chitinispirillales bacterium]
MKHYVYIVRCADDTLYTGWTTDLNERIKTHNNGKGAKYTRGRLPVGLVHFEMFEDRSSALKREIQIKKLTRMRKEKLFSLLR